MHKISGLSLIEVLVAAVLLFASLSLATLAFNISIKTESSALNALKRSAEKRFVNELIAEQLRLRPQSDNGEGTFNGNSFQWKTINIHSKWSRAGFDIESNSEVEFGKFVSLKVIEINYLNEKYIFKHLYWR